MTPLELILSEITEKSQYPSPAGGGQKNPPASAAAARKGVWGKGTPKQSEARYGAGRRSRLLFPKKSAFGGQPKPQK